MPKRWPEKNVQCHNLFTHFLNLYIIGSVKMIVSTPHNYWGKTQEIWRSDAVWAKKKSKQILNNCFHILQLKTFIISTHEDKETLISSSKYIVGLNFFYQAMKILLVNIYLIYKLRLAMQFMCSLHTSVKLCMALFDCTIQNLFINYILRYMCVS